MCGILAILLSRETEDRLRTKAKKLQKTLRHRGPDASGLFIYRTVLTNGDIVHSALAHERLSIVDPLSGRQPLFDATGDVACTVNGEIYNHVSLAEQFLSKEDIASFKSKSDCAVIPHLYARTGSEFVQHLDGKFAFVVADASGNFLAARDPIGICSLYIGWSADGSICFASELKGLLNDCVHFQEFPNGCFYDSLLQIGDCPVFTRWYSPVWWPIDAPVPRVKYDAARIRDALEAAVTKRLMAEVPVGVFLSGGLDSSLIASIASKAMKAIQSSGMASTSWYPKLHSFSIGLTESPDLKMAREVAEFLDTVHHELTFTVEEGIEALEDVIMHLETYDVTTIRAATPMLLLSRLVKSLGFKVILSGEGADEVFGGYLYFHHAPNSTEFFRETQRKLHDLHYFDVLRANKAPMAAGVEVRVPFLDRQFLDVAMTLDPEEKMCFDSTGKPRMEKFALRRAFEGHLPDSCLWRQKEQFSDGVGYSWIDMLKEHANKVISDNQMTMASRIFRVNPPHTKEAFLYRMIFQKLFPREQAARGVLWGPSIACSSTAAIAWSASFKNRLDQSGRSVVTVHQKPA